MSVGKQFERDFLASVPSDMYAQRLKDPAQSFGESSATRFSTNNPFDYILFLSPYLFTLELKTTASSLTFWREDFDADGAKRTYNIKKHQIKGLQKAGNHSNVVSGFVLNFRSTNETYFVSIGDFIKLTENLPKKSLNKTDVSSCGILIPQRKLKVNYRYDIMAILHDAKEKGR